MTKTVVVGGGLVGSLLTLALKKRGHQVELFEKRPDPRKGLRLEGRSINLIITSRGLHALDKLGLAQKALELCVPVTGRMIHSLTGELAYQPYGRDKTECNYSVSRSDLNNFLLSEAEKAGVPIHFAKELEKADFKNKKLFFHGQTEATTYDFLYGADGAGSNVRAELLKSDSHLKESVEFLSAGYKEMFMPLKADGMPALQKEALHIWPRGHHMLMALPNLDGSFTMTLYLPHQGATPSFQQLNSRERIEEYLSSYFQDALPLMPRALEEFEKNAEGKLGTVRLNRWNAHNDVLLLGDASHAIVPFFGQGMNSGFEDVSQLLDLMDQGMEQGSELLEEMNKIRRPNTEAIADMALENFYEMSAKVGDANFLLRKQVEAKLEAAYPEDYRARYGMITYTLIPYALAFELGKIQEELLDKLCHNLSSSDQVDLHLGKALIDEMITPFKRKHRLSFERFKL